MNDFLGIQKPSTRPATRPGGNPAGRPTTLPGNIGSNRPGGGNNARPDRPTTLPGNIGNQRPGQPNRPGAGDGSNRPNRPNQPGQKPDWIANRPAKPGGPNRPGTGNRPGAGNRPGGGNWDNDHIHQRPDWANRPGAGNIDNRWPRPGRPGYGMNDWIDRHPNRKARWDYWGSNVRHNWHGYHHHDNWFNNNWWNHHHHHVGGWHYGYCFDRHPYAYWWTVPTYVGLRNWFNWSAPASAWQEPVYYDYGTGGNVYYENNNVYVDGQEVGSAEDYAASAAVLATVEPPADEAAAEQEDWMPLGTFAVSSSEKESDPTRILQLAVNKQGVVSGTAYNTATDDSQTILGQVDKETQRVAFRVGESDDVVVETGLYNLTQDEAPVMVHFGADKVDYWLLVRLEQSENQTVEQ